MPEMEIFEREIPSHDSRPDFYFEDKEQNKWILEIKIGDKKKLHFEQYRNEYPKGKIAFIANYDATPYYNKKYDIVINKWKDFVD
jgi:hypothetical protein